MAKTKRTPGPKPRYSQRRDYHIPLSIELANAVEAVAEDEAKQEERRKSIIATVEAALRRDPTIAAKMASLLGPMA